MAEVAVVEIWQSQRYWRFRGRDAHGTAGETPALLNDVL